MRPFSKQQTRNWLAGQEQRVSSASVAIRTADDKVLVVKAGYKRYWSFPGGVIDAGETPAAAAVREVREETGIELSTDQLTFCMVVDRVSDIAQTYQFIFEAVVDAATLAAHSKDDREIELIDIVHRESIAHAKRYYSASTKLWAAGEFGYHEQVFELSAPQSEI